MNIFIYGNQSFKKDIHKILQDSKINEELDDLKIVEINEIKTLKENISSNPNDVYLIDDDKIIRKKNKFKFLRPKDGIEEEFLLECGVDDLSIDSLDELPHYIVRKYNRQNLTQNDNLDLNEDSLILDSELSGLLNSENEHINEEPIGLNIKELDNLIEDESIKIEDKKDNEFSFLEDFSEDFGLNNVSYDYDDDSIYNDSTKSDEDILADILNSSILDEEDLDYVTETFEDVNFLDEIFPQKPILEEKEFINDFIHDSKVENLEDGIISPDESLVFENNNELIINENKDIINNLEDFNDEKKEIIIRDIYEDDNIQGDNSMGDEFLELDSLNEQDLIAALEDIPSSISEPKNEKVIEKNSGTVELNSTNVQDIANLISNLLNNKTLEITIKIKD
ncbi:hypothetical protein [Aliarcobacter lanthieri]|uniref:hypothetical protein n=1 Tax=Aliarcobacter lanthieri TaxID=1355374 RepID=UPI00047A68A1|nr:hypothetical protein [Aliarcobacter lanthieri]QKF58370.1 hypothetical protein ALANTH_0237 [Aliarcobacter lanthieri]